MSAAVVPAARDKCVDVDAEFVAATARTERVHFDLLTAEGVSRTYLWSGAMRFGIATITMFLDGTYAPASDGVLAYIVPTLPLAAPWESGCESEDIADLVAWIPNEPRRWWRRLGVMPILNPNAILHSELFKEPLPLRSTPLSWLQNGGDGCVLLDCAVDPRLFLGGVKELMCDDIEVADLLGRWWDRPLIPKPSIRVASAGKLPA